MPLRLGVVLMSWCLCLGAELKVVVHGSGPELDEAMGVPGVKCAELTDRELGEVLGPAYNGRYMAIEAPLEAGSVAEGAEGGAFKDARLPDLTDPAGDFSVGEQYTRTLSELPAWGRLFDGQPTAAPQSRRPRRGSPGETKSTSRPISAWGCESRVRWLDLGPDYFPRYLRSVECTQRACWYGHFVCTPRSFTIRLLRRRAGRCAPAGRVGDSGLPQVLRELWLWEERAVNFCCECSARQQR